MQTAQSLKHVLLTAVAAIPERRLPPRDMVTDDMLRALAHGDAARDMGEINADDQRLLAMLLPDICGELLARRAAMQQGDAA